MDDSVQCWSILRIESFKSGIWIPLTEHDILISSTESTISTSLIHCIFPWEIVNKYIHQKRMLLMWRICQTEDLKSAVVVVLLHNSLKNPPSLVRTEFVADSPDWHLWSWAGVWPPLITCGDVCSDTLEIHGCNSCGYGAEEDAVGFAKTFPDFPCVYQILGCPFLSAWHSQRTA